MLNLSTFILVLALLCAQFFIGGARLLYSIPAYGLVAMAGLVVVSRVRSIRISPSGWCLASALILVGYLFSRELRSPVEYLARPDFFMVGGVIVTYLLTAFWLVKPGQRVFVLTCLLVFALLQVAVGLVQFARGDNYMLLPWIIRTQYESRASGLYVCPNHLAGLLEVLGVFGLSLFFWAQWKFTARLAVGYLALMCFAGLAITGSRGGYLSTSVALLVFMTLSLTAVRRVAPWQFWKLLLGIIVAVVASAAAALTVIYNSHFLMGRFQAILAYHDVRLLIWTSALKAWHLEPWFGTGAGMFLYWGRHFREMSIQNDPIFVHNDYLHLLAEYGIAGAICMAFLLVTHLTFGFRWFQRITKLELAQRGEASSHRLALQIGALSAMSAYLAHSVVDFNLHIPANALLMAFIFGMIANPGRETEPAPGDTPKSLPIVALLVPVLAVALAWVSLPKLAGEYYAELGRVGIRDKHWDDAQRYADAGLLVEQSNPNLYYYLGESKRMQSVESTDLTAQLDFLFQARDSFETGIKLFPEDLDILLKLGRVYDALKDFPSAEKIYGRAIDADPNLGMVYAYYGLHFHEQGMFKLAREQYEHSQRLQGNGIADAGLKELDELESKARQSKEPKPMDLRMKMLQMGDQIGQTPPTQAPAQTPPAATPAPTGY